MILLFFSLGVNNVSSEGDSNRRGWRKSSNIHWQTDQEEESLRYVPCSSQFQSVDLTVLLNFFFLFYLDFTFFRPDFF